MKRTIILLIAAILTIALLTGCNAEKNKADNSQTDASAIKTVYPVDCTVSLLNEKQAKYLKKDADRLPIGVKGKKELSRPEAVEFSWTHSGNDINEFVLSISKNEDMSNAVTYTSDENSLSVYNLEIDTEYYWTVSTNEKISTVSKFETSSDAPRMLYVDGITNVRDMGGWIIENGTRTNQGLIYRCGRLNESADNGCSVIITESGKKAMLDDLNVKTELDLRQPHTGETGGIASSPLGEGVTYMNCPIDWSGDLRGDNNGQILKIFSILSDKTNYPIIVHCSIGTDRTGMLSFLLNALLGFPEKELYRDYMFSNFAEIGGKRKLTNLTESQYYNDVKNSSGDTLSEKAYNFLHGIGVPKEQLNAIISNFTE